MGGVPYDTRTEVGYVVDSIGVPRVTGYPTKVDIFALPL